MNFLDRAAFDLIDPLRSPVALDIVRVLTDIGSLPVAALVIAIAAVATRRPELAIAMVILFALVHLGKDLVERPRPESRFYEPNGHSFPSGHSAYATAWLAAAWLTGRRALIVSAAVLVLAVGASRLYLHVHYLTDVLGGFALGAAVFLPVLARK